MKTVNDVKQAYKIDLFVDLLNHDQQHISRAKQKAGQVRKQRRTEAERQLEMVKADHAKALEVQQHLRELDFKQFQARATKMAIDHNATTATLVTAALAVGYILAFL